MKYILLSIISLMSSACTSRADDNHGTGGSNSSGSKTVSSSHTSAISSSSKSSSGSGTTSSPTSSSGSGEVDASVPCVSCSDKLFSYTNYDLCSDSTDGGLSSKVIWSNLQTCACGDQSVCKSSCLDNYCLASKPGSATVQCNSCIRAAEGCGSYFDDCAFDVKK